MLACGQTSRDQYVAIEWVPRRMHGITKLIRVVENIWNWYESIRKNSHWMTSSLYENWEHELYAKCYWQTHHPRDFYLGIKRSLQAFRASHEIDSKFSTLRQQYYTWSICNSIYYSNLTEETGLSMTDTQLITMEILKKGANVETIIREREQSFKEPSKFRDVVQHAMAFKFLQSLTAWASFWSCTTFSWMIVCVKMEFRPTQANFGRKA